jgi:hypothetical protein
MPRGLSVFIVTVALSVPGPVWAQSAADKATARELARSGIRLYQEGDADSALKKLKKAQELYNAPTHLLYIARAQTQLGHLVEATEVYRSLARMELKTDSSRLFHQSQEAGAEELAQLLPRLAQLTINVYPAETEGLEVFLDEKPFKLAALSVERATNPGSRLLKAHAPGHMPLTVEISLNEGESRSIDLVLEKEAEEEADRPSDSVAGVSEAGEADGTSGPMGLLAGARIGAVVPLGMLDAQSPTLDYFYPGFAAKFIVGFRFLDHFGVKTFLGLGGANPGSGLKARGEAQAGSVSSTDKTSIVDLGVALFATSDPRKGGPFGELGFLLLHRYHWSIEREGGGIEPCSMNAKYSGGALHVGGGWNFPLTSYFTFAPEVDVAVGRHKKLNIQGDCQTAPSEPDFPTSGSTDDTIADRALHLQILVAVGGDFHFGDSLFQ